VAGKRVDIRHQHGAALCRRGAADALAERDAHASRLALERPEDKLLPTQEVEAGPVQLGQAVIDRGRGVRGIGDRVGFTAQQRVQFLGEALVQYHTPADLAGGGPWRGA